MNSPLLETADYYPIVVVGGGILGAGLFREFSLHKVPCLLVDKKIFPLKPVNPLPKCCMVDFATCRPLILP